MTVSTTTVRVFALANGVTRTFATDYVFLSADDLLVQRADATTGAILQTYVLGTDYTVAGGDGSNGSVTFVTAPASPYKIIIQRAVPYTQPTTFADGVDLDAVALERALDRLVLEAQQIEDTSNRVIRLSAATADPNNDNEYALPAPVANLLVVGKADASGWENRAAGTISGSPVTLPLSLTEGGTGATTAANARTNLGLGTAAVLDTGTTTNTIPVLDGSGLLVPGVLPAVSTSAVGALPAWGSTTNGVYLSGTGWTTAAGGRYPLGEFVLGADSDFIGLSAGGTEWDGYEEFEVEAVWYAAAVNKQSIMRWNIDGTLRSSSAYAYLSDGHYYSSGYVSLGANPGALAGYISIDPSASNAANTAVGASYFLGRIKNKLAFAGNIVIMHGHHTFINDAGSLAYSQVVARTAAGSTGFFRGVRISLLDISNLKAGSYLRVWGIDPGTFA